VVVGARILLLGGSNGEGSYLPLGKVPVFHTDTLSWSWLSCTGRVPGARAGHVAATVSSGGGGSADWRVFVFGGGNSSSGFCDMHALSSDACWEPLPSSTAADAAAQPSATEGAAMAHSGGMLLVCGGYTAAGATRQVYAWGCEPSLAAPAGHGERAPVPPPAKTLGGSSHPLVLLACPTGINSQRHAYAATGAIVDALPGAQIVATPYGGEGEGAADVPLASTQEQALSLLLQRLQQLQLQRAAFGEKSSSLLSRARLAAAVQPCQCAEMTRRDDTPR
jgi:hypothetical protein